MNRRHPLALPPHLRALDRTLIMGVVNVTPDSFSDGGRHFDAHAGVAHGLALVAQGADIVDVGENRLDQGLPELHRMRNCAVFFPSWKSWHSKEWLCQWTQPAPQWRRQQFRRVRS